MSSEVAELEQLTDDIPNDWAVLPLSRLCVEVADRVDPASLSDRLATHYVGLEHIGQGSGRLEGTGSVADVVSQKSRFHGGDVLYGKLRPNLRKVARPDFDGVCSTDVIVFRAKQAADPDFLFQVLQSEPLVAHAVATAAGTKMPRTHARSILSFEIAAPPLEEQRRIAEVLRSVDEAIARTKVAIEQASRAIEGMLQRLFVEGIGHSDFKDGHSTPVPTSWDEKPLGDLAATPVTYGVVQPGPNVADGVPFVRGGDFPNGSIDIGALRKIGKDVASQYRRTQLRGGEIVVSLVGYPGACAIVPDVLAGANIARQAALIRPSAEIVASYLYQFLRSPIGQDRLKKETIGSAQQVINLRDLKEVIVAVPPKREQEQIAAILADLDAFVELETANLDKLTALKGSIAADLLSGHVRVPA